MAITRLRNKAQEGLLTGEKHAPAQEPFITTLLKWIFYAITLYWLCLLVPSFASVTEAVSTLWQPSMDAHCVSASGWRCRNARQHAERLLSRHPLIDGHVDVPVQARYRYGNKIDTIPFDQPVFANGSYPTLGHVDIPRLRAGKSGGFFWSAYVVCPNETTVGKNFEHAATDIAVRDTLEQLDVIKQMTDKYHHDFALVGSVDAARKAFKHGQMISFIGIEGAHSIGNSLFALRTYASLFSNTIPGP
ncbi:hypothetical protein, partial [Sporisorium scitamineum]